MRLHALSKTASPRGRAGIQAGCRATLASYFYDDEYSQKIHSPKPGMEPCEARRAPCPHATGFTRRTYEQMSLIHPEITLGFWSREPAGQVRRPVLPGGRVCPGRRAA